MDTVNIYGLWPDLVYCDLVYCVWAVGRLYTALVAKRLKYLKIKKSNSGRVISIYLRCCWIQYDKSDNPPIS